MRIVNSQADTVDKILDSDFYYHFLNPKTKEPVFKMGGVSGFKSNNFLVSNYYSVIWILEGKCSFVSEFNKYNATPGSMFFFSPYQIFKPEFLDETEAVIIQFHSDFYCVEKHQKEIACNGTLFNNLLPPPYIDTQGRELENFAEISSKIFQEINGHETAAYDAVLSYLKLFLIQAVRLKKEQFYTHEHDDSHDFPENLQKLLNLIEKYYKNLHSPHEYAKMLSISDKTLVRLTKSVFKKTPLELITERIIIEAKQKLYLTTHSVKQIAAELGFKDEYYFSRMFKKNTTVSPTIYRKKTSLMNKV